MLSIYKNYPKIWEKCNRILDSRTRSIQKEMLVVPGKSMKMKATFYSDAASLWNKAPEAIKESKSLLMVKKEIKKNVLTLPI